ncbi:MAG TPA: hypothetical protein VJG31_00365 [Candidatus Nanoarchaeia archaeon]|nr:hypothetical protein [Candidatus Nanoarchaeia archaeon]
MAGFVIRHLDLAHGGKNPEAVQNEKNGQSDGVDGDFFHLEIEQTGALLKQRFMVEQSEQ